MSRTTATARPPHVAGVIDPPQKTPRASAQAFDYDTAFGRNIGWVTHAEQRVLRASRVAIAGMGGVGGIHLMTLTRLGIGGFTVADFDTFGLVNFNRQTGATVDTIDKPKCRVMAEAALAVNPTLDLRRFDAGVTDENIDAFLDGADVYVDGLDFFVLGLRRKVFDRCARRGIPAVTAAPLGMGAAFLYFAPGGMTFDEYFDFDSAHGDKLGEQLRFLVGLSPAGLHRGYLVDPTTVNLETKRGPSTNMACTLCAGITATNVLKLLLRRGRVPAAPRSVQFDSYTNRLRHVWRPWGNRNPVQRLALRIGARQLARFVEQAKAQPAEAKNLSTIESILDAARWAPSGDNTQPWRFEVHSDRRVTVHGFAAQDFRIYDLQGQAGQLAIGALLETMRIAATGFGLDMRAERIAGSQDANPSYDVTFSEDAAVRPDPCLPYIESRVTQRRPVSTRPLMPWHLDALNASVGEGFSVQWRTSFADRLRVAKLLYRSAHIRLTEPQAYEVHRQILQWHARFSDDRIPDQAVGTDPFTTRFMQWAMASWGRVAFLNKYFAGTVAPRVQLDFLPGLCCAGHFFIVADSAPRGVDDFVAGGRALQRLWLTATKLGLQFQPEMTPLIFSRYVREGVAFTELESSRRTGEHIVSVLDTLLGREQACRAVCMGRVGFGPTPRSRSLRLPLERLLRP